MRTLFANTIFFGDSMTQAIGEYGFLDMTNIVYQRSATIDVLITKIPEVAATLPKQVVIFTGLNDCNHYTEIADYRRDYVTMLQQLKASIPGVKTVSYTHLVKRASQQGRSCISVSRVSAV